MTFAEIIPLLLEGKKIRRQTEANSYFCILENKKQGTLNWSKTDNSDFGFFILTREDLEADDWQEVME